MRLRGFRVTLSKQQGFSLIELVIAMLVISIAVLSYEIILYRAQSSETLLNNDAELVGTADNRFNEYLITGALDSGSSPSVIIAASGNDNWNFTSGNDADLSINMDLS